SDQCSDLAQNPFRNYAIFLVLLHTGLRVSELLALDLDQYSGKHIHTVKRKGKKVSRQVFLGKEARVALDRYLEGVPNKTGTPLFRTKNGNRLSRQDVDYVLKSVALQANVICRPTCSGTVGPGTREPRMTGARFTRANSPLGLRRLALDQLLGLAEKGQGVRALGPWLILQDFLPAGKDRASCLPLTQLVLHHGQESQSGRMIRIAPDQRRQGIGVALLLKLANAVLGGAEGDAVDFLVRRSLASGLHLGQGELAHEHVG